MSSKIIIEGSSRQVNRQEFVGFDDGNLDFDDEVIDHEDDERRSRFGSWSFSVMVHIVVLLLLAFVVMAHSEPEKRAPVRSAVLPTSEPPPPRDPTPAALAEVETEIEAETDAYSDLLDVSNLLDMTITDPSNLLAASAAVATHATAVASAIGAAGGGGGQGGLGAFGAGTGGGDGLGGGGFFGVGDGGGGSARNVLYIIDMSRSLKTPQIALIKDRLVNSLFELTKRQRFEILFFSGPTWQLFQDPGLVSNGWEKVTNWHNFRPTGELPVGEWRPFPPNIRGQVVDYIDNTLVTTGGTDWRHPLSVAYAMDPAPDMIYFLTDGKVDNSELTLDIIDTATSEGSAIPINTIAFGLSDQDGVATLSQMSEDSGGQHIAYTMDDIADMYEQLKREGRRN